ncbi:MULTISPECIES: heme ABC transporter ATP-binding protein [Agrobacterium]|uniref:Heme ABC transporter ATP-binding protein n=1 Tax=Agrobacterium tumefaciens TaxID=358 RepID=A0AAF0KCN7_AGRTU|nr:MULTISPECIES: heme ABC transporter ATP-binding protein [Agrobacterium]WGM58631.1 heme ABC transporter ATP-binding protein [Agrobacterium tumefaciens]CVI59270.1 Hemin import ATP-binding protein HmuV [Agrobacterium salinitolerans str. Hayward 0363]
MIRAENLTLIRSGRRLLDSVSVDLKPGKVNVIIGPNGAGKSTLMKVLSGEMRPGAGSVTYNDVDLPAFTPVQLARLRAVLPQSTQLAFPFTALEIVRMGAVAQGARTPEEQARRALAKAGLRGFEQRSYNMLSGGEQQRVQFARALAQVPNPMENGEARALFLDEPTASLDIGHQIAVLETARDFASGGGLVLAILHDLNLAAEFADQLIVMHGGRVTASGPSLETISDETIARVYGIGGVVGRLPARHIPYVLPQSRHR